VITRGAPARDTLQSAAMAFLRRHNRALLCIAAGLLLPALAYGWTGNLDQLRVWYRTVTDTNAPNLLVRRLCHAIRPLPTKDQPINSTNTDASG
jgi:hypothetical protein